LCAVFFLLAIPPFGYAQSIPELKSKAEDGDVQAQLALAKAYHLGEGVAKESWRKRVYCRLTTLKMRDGVFNG
jgi:hypothetical protein